MDPSTGLPVLRARGETIRVDAVDDHRRTGSEKPRHLAHSLPLGVGVADHGIREAMKEIAKTAPHARGRQVQVSLGHDDGERAPRQPGELDEQVRPGQKADDRVRPLAPDRPSHPHGQTGSVARFQRDHGDVRRRAELVPEERVAPEHDDLHHERQLVQRGGQQAELPLGSSRLELVDDHHHPNAAVRLAPPNRHRELAPLREAPDWLPPSRAAGTPPAHRRGLRICCWKRPAVPAPPP